MMNVFKEINTTDKQGRCYSKMYAKKSSNPFYNIFFLQESNAKKFCFTKNVRKHHLIYINHRIAIYF